MRLVLASASPRRAELLRAAGFEFDVQAADVDESVSAGETAAQYVLRLSAEKVAAVSAILDDAAADVIVLGADTAVVVDGTILGKPQDDHHARVMLRTLSARRHEVMTGITVKAGASERGHVETTAVLFSELTEDEIDWYVRSGEGRDKAGAYAIQGLASRFIPRIEGSYSNVVGLPIAAVCGLIRLVTQLQNRAGAR